MVRASCSNSFFHRFCFAGPTDGGKEWVRSNKPLPVEGDAPKPNKRTYQEALLSSPPRSPTSSPQCTRSPTSSERAQSPTSSPRRRRAPVQAPECPYPQPHSNRTLASGFVMQKRHLTVPARRGNAALAARQRDDDDEFEPGDEDELASDDDDVRRRNAKKHATRDVAVEKREKEEAERNKARRARRLSQQHNKRAPSSPLPKGAQALAPRRARRCRRGERRARRRRCARARRCARRSRRRCARRRGQARRHQVRRAGCHAAQRDASLAPRQVGGRFARHDPGGRVVEQERCCREHAQGVHSVWQRATPVRSRRTTRRRLDAPSSTG